MDIKPITREEMYLAKAAGQDVSLPEPITRKEMFLAKIAGMEVETPGAITRIEMFANKAAVALNRSVIEPLKITENGTYTAPEGVDGYNPVTVEVVGAGGGGSSADVRYVTFMSYDGSVEYGKKAVAVGDDCADPIARGVFDTPTRESTAQYSYTHYGWSLSANGATNNSALKSVTEDRTVYATFVSAIRYYTVSYYDGTSLLNTESVAYGSLPSTYTPSKSGFEFGGWQPEVVAVTGDVTYTAIWTEKVTFANASWKRIAEISEAGTAKNYFSLFDSKQVDVTINGVITKYTVKIVGFDHDTLADGSGKKAGLSILFFTIPTTKYKFHNTQITSDMINYQGIKGYPQCDIATIVRGFKNNLPSELQSVIKPVLKQYNKFQTKDTIMESEEAIWIPSTLEVFDRNHSVTSMERALGTKYAAFASGDYMGYGSTNQSKTMAYLSDGTRFNGAYWAREVDWGDNNAVSCSSNGSGAYSANEIAEYNIVMGFCI